MALKSTVIKVQLSVADITRCHYEDYSLTLAKHPSETDERLMARLIAFAVNAKEDLFFGKGLSTDDEPDIWQKSLDDRILHWIDLGQPDEKRIRQACGKSERVDIYCYQKAAAQVWWESTQRKANPLKKLGVHLIQAAEAESLGDLAEKSMTLNCTIDEGEILLASQSKTLNLKIECWK